MRPMTAWKLGMVLVMVGLAAGCEEPVEEPVAQAPVQEPAPPPFPEEQVPAPEPQPVAEAPPVDSTAARPQAAPAAPQPKGSYAPAPPRKAARTYVVRKGDTLQKISKKFYGTTKKWRRIYKANRKTLSKGPDKIQPGMQLVIP